MAHTHDVHDTGKRFEINGISRFIKETSETKLVLVQGDHKSEVVTFEMPRFIDGHDMLLCNKIRVHYINIDTKTSDSSADIYEVTDLKLCEDCGEEETLLFTWTIEAPATKYFGSLSFLVKFECTEGDNILYQWNTARYVNVNVLNGIDNGEEFVEKYSNVLEEWYNELTNGADSIEELNQQAIAGIEVAKENAEKAIEDKTHESLMYFDENARVLQEYIAEAVKEAAKTEVDNEKGNIAQLIIDELQGLPVLGVVDENNTITITTMLSGGEYSLMYENEDGTLTEIGTIIVEGETFSYTNLVPTSIDTDGSIYNDVGYMNNMYISSSTGLPSSNAGTVTTGYMELPLTFYVKGMSWNISSSIDRIFFYDSNFNKLDFRHAKEWGTAGIITEDVGNGFTKFTIPQPTDWPGNKILGYKYIRMCLTGSGDNFIVTTDNVE